MYIKKHFLNSHMFIKAKIIDRYVFLNLITFKFYILQYNIIFLNKYIILLIFKLHILQQALL